jgi:UDP-GlcNAc:undecaprenyl-phosphate GlcNAc-1-phosphate transferase
VSGILREPAALGLLAALASWGCTWLARAVAPRVGMISRPNPIVPQHTRPVAYLGGIGIAGGMASALFAAWRVGGPPDAGGLPWPALIAGGAAFLLLGLVDDARAFAPGTKLLLQGAAAALAVGSGLRLFAFASPAADVALTVLWLVLMVNAVNVTDVCDGLVAGIVAFTLAVVGAFVPELRALCAAGAGACAGFLWFNYPPASIYLGDAGSHLLGFLLAVVTARGARDPSAATTVASMLLLAGVVLFEVVLLVRARRRRGIAWWRGSPDHFSLRLLAAGWSRARTDAAAWGAAALLAVAAFALPRLHPAAGAAVMAVAAAASAAAMRVLLGRDASHGGGG